VKWQETIQVWDIGIYVDLFYKFGALVKLQCYIYLVYICLAETVSI